MIDPCAVAYLNLTRSMGDWHCQQEFQFCDESSPEAIVTLMTTALSVTPRRPGLQFISRAPLPSQRLSAPLPLFGNMSPLIYPPRNLAACCLPSTKIIVICSSKDVILSISNRDIRNLTFRILIAVSSQTQNSAVIFKLPGKHSPIGSRSQPKLGFI